MSKYVYTAAIVAGACLSLGMQVSRVERAGLALGHQGQQRILVAQDTSQRCAGAERGTCGQR